jgi:hypothetical protein
VKEHKHTLAEIDGVENFHDVCMFGYPPDREDLFLLSFLREYLKALPSFLVDQEMSYSQVLVELDRLMTNQPDELDWLLWDTTTVCGANCFVICCRGIDLCKVFEEPYAIQYLAMACFQECSVVCCG